MKYWLVFIALILVHPLSASAQTAALGDSQIVLVFDERDNRSDVRLDMVPRPFPAETCNMDRVAIQRADDAGRLSRRVPASITVRHNGYAPVTLDVPGLDTVTYIPVMDIQMNYFTKADFRDAGHAVSAVRSNGQALVVGENDVIAELEIQVWSCDRPRDLFLYVYKGQQVDLVFGPPEWDQSGNR